MKYTIWTEDKGDEELEAIVTLVSGGFNSFSIVQGTGYWKGKGETSLQVIIFAAPGERDHIFELARWIKKLLEQEAVLVTVEQTEEEELV